MDKVQKHNSFNTNTPSSESYRNYLRLKVSNITQQKKKVTDISQTGFEPAIPYFEGPTLFGTGSVVKTVNVPCTA
jgi:hypothetical protein